MKTELTHHERKIAYYFKDYIYNLDYVKNNDLDTVESEYLRNEMKNQLEDIVEYIETYIVKEEKYYG